MNIGIDLDGVVYETERMFRIYADKFNNEVGGKVVCDNAHDVEVRYNWGEQLSREYIDRYTIMILDTAPVFKDAKEVMTLLKQKHKIFLITARGLCHKDEIATTEKRLKQDGIPFDEIIYNQTSKVKACKDNKIDIMIDDNPNNVSELSGSGIKCLHFKEEFTTSVIGVDTVSNWQEVKEYFKL